MQVGFFFAGAKPGHWQPGGWLAQVQRMQTKKGLVRKEREAASIAAGLLGLAFSDLLKKNVAHTPTAVERFRAAHCVCSMCSGILPGDIENQSLAFATFS